MNLMDLKLFRKMQMPLRFKNKTAYRHALSNLIVDHLQVSLQTVAVKYNQINLGGISEHMNDKYYRSRGIACYLNVTIKPFEIRDQRAFHFQPLLNMRKNNYILLVSNKEHSSAYSRDDIWVVSSNSNFDHACVLRSYFYGPSANGEIELTPMSSRDDRIVQDTILKPPLNGKCYAIRAISASSELPVLVNLKESLHSCPLISFVASPVPTNPGTSSSSTQMTQIENGRFKSPSLKQRDLLVPGYQVLYNQLLTKIINQYRLNNDQTRVLQTFAQSIAGNQDSPITLVHGVFGAGKSFLVGVIVLFLYQVKENNLFCNGNGARVVISSMTNVAVDLILLNLMKLGFTQFSRVGSLRKIAKPLLPYTMRGKNASHDVKELQLMLKDTMLTDTDRKDIQRTLGLFRASAYKETISNSFVIGVTCLATNFEILDDFSCPIVILDECSQMTEPMSLLPLCRFSSQRALLVGDPKQLPPTVQTTIDPSIADAHGIEWTLFERLAECGVHPIMLRTQYRCHPQIANISNSLFYDGKLSHGVAESDRTALIEGFPHSGFLNVPDGKEQTAFGGSFCNPVEAHHICDLASQLVLLNIPASDIGIITLYKAQEHLICKLLGEHAESNMLRLVQVSTVDAYQGAEKPVIILSTVRTKSKGFIEEPRRINVAITRAKQ
ncbi:hypothetical protein RTP6_7802 [Batrachochytrium dendrobatidis]